jgi:hypothetical protein
MSADTSASGQAGDEADALVVDQDTGDDGQDRIDEGDCAGNLENGPSRQSRRRHPLVYNDGRYVQHHTEARYPSKMSERRSVRKEEAARRREGVLT